MVFTLIVHGDPQSSQGPHTALRFAKAVVAGGHGLAAVFFYHDGAANGSLLAVSPQDECSLPDQWLALHRQCGVELVVCVGAALRHGVLDAGEARRYDRHPGLKDGFRLGGLGELVEFASRSERVLTFA